MQNRTALVLATPAEGEELATEVPVELVRCPACPRAAPPPPRGQAVETERRVHGGRERRVRGVRTALPLRLDDWHPAG
jgi:hypothetical protein